MHKELQDLLRNTKVGSDDFPKLKTIITISTDTTVVEAIEKLNTYNVSSVPVVNNQGKLVGMLDTFDIIGFSLEIFPSESDLEEDFFRSFLYSNFQLETRKVSEILNPNYTDKTFSMDSSANLFDVAEILSHGLHRLPILKENDKIDSTQTHYLENIISQTNIVQFISKNLHLVPKLRDSTLEQLNMASKEILTVSDSDRMIDVLRMILTTKFSAILSLNQDKKPSISLSANDMRNLEKDSFASLFLSVEGYYRQMKKQRKLICCDKSTSFGGVIQLMIENQIHRVWVSDKSHHLIKHHDDFKVIGIVTMTDILERVLLPL